MDCSSSRRRAADDRWGTAREACRGQVELPPGDELMSEGQMPFVAVIGGLRQLQGEKQERARTAGREVGAELAKAGFGLVVYFSDEASLEPYVVAGYVAALPPGAGAIRVRYSEAQRGLVAFPEEETRRDIFEHRLFPGEDWEAPFYRSLAEAEGVDAVLFLAGGPSTLIAGQIAIARGLPIVTIDEFGGSAGKIWNQLAHVTADRKAWGTQTASKFVTELAAQCAAVARQRREAEDRSRQLAAYRARRHQATYAAGAVLVLMTTLFFGFVMPFARGYAFLMLLGLMAAGATGAVVRGILLAGEDSDARVSLVLGAVAGFIVGLAYLIPQWIGASHVLEPESGGVSANDKIQFASAVLVALSAGVGFDTVFNRLKTQAQTNPIAPPR
jgi:hypothetical protein